jgi:Ca2+-transporting ATPase
MTANKYNIEGLSNAQVLASRKKYGKNQLDYKKENRFLNALFRIVKDPMVILLIIASTIYFINGKTGDGIFLSCAIIFQTSISLFQYSRSKNALEKLQDFSQPTCKVIRSNKIVEIRSENIVVGDRLIVEEGFLISADGTIILSNDFSVNESILTGESLSIFKDKSIENNCIYSGTVTASGLAIAIVTAIGNSTKLGKIGSSLERIKEEKTPLELQIENFVKKMVLVGAIAFISVWITNYWHSQLLINSLLKSLSLAMSILPEEIPVAFTTFMAIGSWRLMKMGIIVKQMKTVETLGSATVICTDKTGTITENKMSLAQLFELQTNTLFKPGMDLNSEQKELVKLAMFASEPVPFDPMEVELHNYYEKVFTQDERKKFEMIHEYSLSGKPPMMTHVFEHLSGTRIIAAKGAVEALINVSNLCSSDRDKIIKANNTLSTQGYRVLGVGETQFEGDNFPKTQHEFPFKFVGLVAFYDPPKKNIQKVLEDYYTAGISVKIITGDNALTTKSIAQQIGFKGFEKSITGEELMLLEEKELRECVMNINIFSRMFPEAKLKIINALKAENQIVAMTGDGVNDGPALKAAHIGIAMGEKGTEIAKQAASLVLLKDDLSKIVEAIAMGRKIYANLKKAIQYIISIHIPIILTVFIPLALGWKYPNIFSPLHIIFLEIIMGPTCSIIYENEPMEPSTMFQKPRKFTTTFFHRKELSISIIQGFVITAGTLFIYQYACKEGYNEALTRTMTFTVLIVANIFLTLINRSFYFSVLKTLRYKNNMVFLIIIITMSIVGILLFVKPFTDFFDFQRLSMPQLIISCTVGFISVIWFEMVKFIKRKKVKTAVLR